MVKPKPTGLTKWLFRAPSCLYRARLGFLMGVAHDGTSEGRVEMMNQIPIVALAV